MINSYNIDPFYDVKLNDKVDDLLVYMTTIQTRVLKHVACDELVSCPVSYTVYSVYINIPNKQYKS